MGGAQDSQDDSYALAWPRSQRWNPSYSVPRNSFEQLPPANLALRNDRKPVPPSAATTSLGSFISLQSTLGQGRGGTSFEASVKSPEVDESETPEDLSNLSHWLETLSELYMNNLDNRARWDPRWLNVTHRERYGGLSSSAVTVVDYISGQPDAAVTTVTTKQHLAELLQERSKGCALRVVIITDVSRFTMGAIGQTYNIDPEFWFEHLANSGYAASDSQLKVNNAIWMNWSEQETRFRHRPLPGTGQRTEWNIPRRIKTRQPWAHMKWARLGLMHYLGKKGFNEAEIEVRLSDGRWVTERDVVLDKWGRYMTTSKLAKAKALAEAKEKKKQRKKKGQYPPVANPSNDAGSTPSKVKASNVYRAYSTFEGLPKNLNSWYNRDLRVLAPEGLSHWTGSDETGEKVVVLVFDPTRKMKNIQTKEYTPSLTFMPRAMEIEGYSEEELWRSAGPEETYLDPPPPPISNKQIKAQKKEATKQSLKHKRDALRNRFRRKKADSNGSLESQDQSDDGSESSYTSDDDYDAEYEEQLREEYENPKPYSRDRAFARKYSLSTPELVLRRLRAVSPADVATDNGGEAMIASLLNSIVLDDFWRLLAEMRAELDHLDGDFSGALFTQLVEAVGNSVRQNLSWMRCSLQELSEWAQHLQASAETRPCTNAAIADELALLIADVQGLQARAESTLTMLASSMGLSQSALVIDQTSGINKLTELAFFFVPLSFITAVFSMQVKELTAAPPHIWTWGLALGLVFLTTYLIRILLRSPSVRVGVLHCRATIVNRFSSSKASSAEHRLHTVGNRAVAKFILFFACLITIYVSFSLIAIAFLLFAFLGLWLGAAGTALYFIITRWPEPAVLVPCFILLPIAAAGMWAAWLWAEELGDWTEQVMFKAADGLASKFPEKWRLDSVEDDDLSREGVNTYTRQAMTLAT